MLDSQVCCLILCMCVKLFQDVGFFFFFYHVLPHQYEQLTNNLSPQLPTPTHTHTQPKHPKPQTFRGLGKICTTQCSFWSPYLISSFYSGLSVNVFSMESWIFSCRNDLPTRSLEYLVTEMICQLFVFLFSSVLDRVLFCAVLAWNLQYNPRLSLNSHISSIEELEV